MDFWNNDILTTLYSEPLVGNLPLRVLRLQPGESSDPIIVCELVPTILDDIADGFAAISYTWGSLDDPQRIRCNGLEMIVQNNAFHLLRDFRLPDQPRLIWIDAICINQGDLAERSSQVQMMHLIYSRAASVVIWLGKPDKDSQVALSYAASLDGDKLTAEFCRLYGSAFGERTEAYAQKTYLFGKPLGTDEERSRAVAIVNLVNRPWFSRIWIQQGASLNRSTQVICGASVVDWHQMFALGWMLQPPHTTMWPEYLPCSYEESRDNLEAMNNIQIYKIKVFRDLYTDMALRHLSRARRFFSLLSFTQRFAATDPRDKIFALLGLHLAGFEVTEGDDHTPKPDYTIPWKSFIRV